MSIVSSAIILTIAGIITRLLGFVYRIYMSNAIGAEGMGLYQLIMPIYGLAWSIACSGFTTTVSKLTSQEKAKGESGNIRRILKQSVTITTGTGILVSLIIYFFAQDIAVSILKEPRTAFSLQLLAFAIPFMAAGSCFRGYFFGLQETLVPAINQVFEQIVRMAVIFLLAGFFIPLGLEYACALAVIGIIAEEFFSLIYVLIAYKRVKFSSRKKPSLTQYGSLLLILTMALPLTGNRVTGSLISAYENILLPQRLQLYGMTASEAIQIFGQISGMVMPLIYFPSAFLVSLSISLVPAVSAASAIKNYKRIGYTVSKSVLFASVIGFGAACLFVTFPGELGDVIYNQDIKQMLLLLGVMCPFLYMQTVLSGVLNGLGYQLFLFRNSLISSGIVIGFVYFLVPVYGIYAFIFGWFLSLIVICFLEINKILSNVEINFEFTKWFVKPILSAVCTGLVFKYIANSLLFGMFGRIWGLVIASIALLLVYLFFIMLTGCLSFDDMRSMIASIKPKKTPDTTKENM